MTGSDLKERITPLTLKMGGDGWAWVPGVPTWAWAKPQEKVNLYSAVGVGARGVTFRIRRRAITLSQAIRWKGRHCMLTSIVPVEGEGGFLELQAAVVELSDCRADTHTSSGGPRFPGILTEKYLRHDSPDLHSEVSGVFVLVTPKEISLRPGTWVEVGGRTYRVEIPHELSAHKNEYEIRREEDC